MHSGTVITLHLKDEYTGNVEGDGEESTESNYLDCTKLKSLVNKYSDHISLPIQMRKEVWQEDVKEEGEDDAEDSTPTSGEYIITDEMSH